jgi:FKBP-type peptidyl-prolyl cis-trans isomerase
MLNQMKEVEGTTVLESGVVLHLLEPGPEGPGRGVRPTAASTVKVHYQGTLPDGTVFDSSLGGEPVNIALGQVIPGWKEGLLKMHEGETVMIGIPPNAAYGDNVSCTNTSSENKI